ncbi:MAG: hypothetical protein L3J66_10530 [Bacteroidales bacterium]|nr:hypothetical protein [Bacteroidales bacterium]
MKKFLVLALVSLLFSGLPGCKKTETNNYTPGANKDKYKGTAIVVIRYYEYNPYTGQDEFIEEKEYHYKTSVFINPPMVLDGVSETNAFGLQIYPDRSGNESEEGHVDFSSCIIVNDILVGKVLLQYWNYSLNGDKISGTLTDNHIAESAASNILWAWDEVAGIKMIMPFYMANGTSLTGTISAHAVELTISGQSTDTYRKFTCTINAVSQ